MRKITSFNIEEPIEIRFYNVMNDVSFQLLANPVDNHIKYTLKTIKAGSLAECLSNLGGTSNIVLPMKNYAGWQNDVLAWLTSLWYKDNTLYKIIDIL